MSNNIPDVQVGDIWRLQYGILGNDTYCEYHLILRHYPHTVHGTLYHTYCINDAVMVPDLILDSRSVRDYDAQRVA